METPASNDVQLLKIGDIAQKTEVTMRTLRYYEELRLIEPDHRSKGNFRLYHPNVIHRILFIHSLKKLDLTLEEIRDILGPADTLMTDKAIVDRTRQALQFKKEKITAKLAEITAMGHEVDFTLKILEGCQVCKEEQDNPCDPGCENKHAHLF